MSHELRYMVVILITAFFAFSAVIVVATVMRANDRRDEKRLNDARTERALGQLWDSLKVNRAERRAEHNAITAKLDSLLHPTVIGILTTASTLGGLC